MMIRVKDSIRNFQGITVFLVNLEQGPTDDDDDIEIIIKQKS